MQVDFRSGWIQQLSGALRTQSEAVLSPLGLGGAWQGRHGRSLRISPHLSGLGHVPDGCDWMVGFLFIPVPEAEEWRRGHPEELGSGEGPPLSGGPNGWEGSPGLRREAGEEMVI